MVSLGGIATFAGVNYFKGNEKFYNQYVMPIIHNLDPERAHRLAIIAGKYRLFPRSQVQDNELLVGVKTTEPFFILTCIINFSLEN